MPLASITRLRLRKLRFLPAFLYRAHLSQRQAARSDGFLGGYVAISPGLAFWTVTVWRDAEAMHAYRRSGAHRRAMPKLFDWCDEAAVVNYAHDAPDLPSAADAAGRIGEEGRLVKLRTPSDAHRAGLPWPDGAVPRPSQAIRPRRSRP